MAIADAHPLYREGLARVLSARPQLDVAAQVAGGEDALRLARTGIELLVVELALPGRSGLELLEAVNAERLDVAVVVLTGVLTPSDAHRAVALGARGVLSKTTAPLELGDQVVRAAAGRLVLGPTAQAALAGHLQRSHAPGPRLSARELQVLQLCAEGHLAPAIAQRLHLSVATIRTYLRTAYAKLEVEDRASAVAVAMRHDLIR